MAEKQRQKRHCWTFEEECDLIDIWKEPEVCGRLENKLYRQKTALHEEIALRMRDLGYVDMTAAIIITKLKNLRAEHKAVRDVYIRGTGKGTTVFDDPSKSSCPHYHSLNEILGGKHSVNPPPGLLGQSSAPPQPRHGNAPSTSTARPIIDSGVSRPTSRPKNRSEEEAPICVVCDMECGGHKCEVCKKPMHIIPPCLGEQKEEGFGQDAKCRKCLEDEVSLWQDDSDLEVEKPQMPPKKRKTFAWEDDLDLHDDHLTQKFDSSRQQVPKKRKLLGWEDEYEDSPPPHCPATDRDHGISLDTSETHKVPNIIPATPVTRLPTLDMPSAQPIRRRRPTRDNNDSNGKTVTKQERSVEAVTKSLKEMQDYNWKRWKTVDERQEAELRKVQLSLENKFDKVLSVVESEAVGRREDRKMNREFQQQFLSLLSRCIPQPHQQMSSHRQYYQHPYEQHTSYHQQAQPHYQQAPHQQPHHVQQTYQQQPKPQQASNHRQLHQQATHQQTAHRQQQVPRQEQLEETPNESFNGQWHQL